MGAEGPPRRRKQTSRRTFRRVGQPVGFRGPRGTYVNVVRPPSTAECERGEPIPLDAPDGQCWGCWQNRRDPWEHEVWCPRWDEQESHISGS